MEVTGVCCVPAAVVILGERCLFAILTSVFNFCQGWQTSAVRVTYESWQAEKKRREPASLFGARRWYVFYVRIVNRTRR